MSGEKYRVFLSSCYDEGMKDNREIFRSELLARFNMISGNVGINTYLIDFEFGIPQNTPESEVIRICTNEVSHSDLFLCILGNRYGHCVLVGSLEATTKQIIQKFRPNIIDNDVISVLELEILTALNHNPEKCAFFVQNTVDRAQELDQLINNEVIKREQIYYFDSTRELAELATSFFERNFGGYLSSVNSEKSYDKYRLIARKLRYYIPMEQTQAAINQYIDSSSQKVFILQGGKGCGKTTAIAKWIFDHQNNQNYEIISWFHDLGPLIYVSVLQQMLGITANTSYQYEDDVIYALIERFKTRPAKKLVFIFDGLNHIETIDKIEWLITTLHPEVKVIITTSEINEQLYNNPSIQHIKIEEVDKSDLVHEIFYLEGKIYEYPHMKALLDKIVLHRSLDIIILSLQQFLREVKYISINAGIPFEGKWTDGRIVDYLDRMVGYSQIFTVQLEYLRKVGGFSHIDNLLKYLVCSERGLSVSEMAELVIDGDRLIYQFYFLLESNEDLYYFPKQIQQHFKYWVGDRNIEIIRRKLLSYFRSKNNDRAIIEICYQLVVLKEYNDLQKYLTAIYNLRLVHTNSSQYPDGIASVIPGHIWKKLSMIWCNELTSNVEEYSDEDIFVAFDCLINLGLLEDACRIMTILLKKHKASQDHYSLCTYHQQLASVYDELNDLRAVDHISEALSQLEQCLDLCSPQGKIDTYLLAAAIYSHFLPINPHWKHNINLYAERANEFIRRASRLTKDYLTNHSTLCALSYHNIAYSYTNMSRFEDAKRYILEALNLSRNNSKLYADSLYLYSQICLELRNSYDPELSKAEKAIKECLSIYHDRFNKTNSDACKEDMSKAHNHWAYILDEQGKHEDAVEKIFEAIKLDDSNSSCISLYRTLYNAGLFCLHSYLESNHQSYLERGYCYAKDSLKNALKMVKFQSLEAESDLADIYMLLSKLSFEYNKRILCQYYLFLSVLQFRKMQTNELPIDIGCNFSFSKTWERLVLIVENAFFNCFTNI